MTEQSTTSSIEISGRIEDIPEQLWPSIQRGYEAATRADGAALEKLIGAVLDGISKDARVDIDEIASTVGLPDNQVRDIAFAISITFGLLGDTSATTVELVEALQGRIPDDAQPGLREIATRIEERKEELKSAVAERTLASAVLPSLRQFNVEVDVRFKIADGKVRRAVPVAILYIGSDGEGQDTWLQLSRVEVKTVIEKLEKVLIDLELAASLTSNLISGGE